MPKRTTRTHLGPRFSEGARRAWRRMLDEGLSASNIRGRMVTREGEPLGVGVVDRAIYGDADVTLHLAFQFKNVLGVDPRSWLQAPRYPFVPPAAREHASTVTAHAASSTRRARSAGASR